MYRTRLRLALLHPSQPTLDRAWQVVVASIWRHFTVLLGCFRLQLGCGMAGAIVAAFGSTRGAIVASIALLCIEMLLRVGWRADVCVDK